ncbi:MAG: DNA primase [Ignavibacteria bacterium]|jgi:DNA primase|nr:DNA primase [Ignavibacteria bacterium]MCU7503257.1 DNA primase [Ignavibacteria bacterium]MCU7515797.1 DNA primase [Ignavibacteria bacterium]
MIIPEHKIEEVRSSISIVDVISEFVQLKKRGKNYIGLCPFHQEKTPSFIVSSDKQIFHCFGCHAGGNVFKFLMDYESISFVEAVQEIAKRSGIILDTHENANPEKQSEMEVLYDINTLAAKFFSNNLLQNPAGEAARKYFAGRKINLQTQRTFGLGYALPEWDGFLRHAKSNAVELEKAQQLGLIDKKDGGNYYDKFRDRIIFPIFSPNGRVIAFGGRIMEKNPNLAKYLNSPESPVYFKRKTLYGLFHSKDEIRKLDKAILVEGYIDLISLYQHGIKNVVASCGTALTEDQVQMLSRYTRNIVVFYDSDPAGIKASLRSIELLVKQNFEVKIAELPDGEDPDSYVQNVGRKEFEEAMGRALNFLEYQTLQYEKQGLFNDPEGQTKAIRELIQSASYVNDELKRNLLIKSIARKFNLREKLLETEMEKLKKSSSSQGEHHTHARQKNFQQHHEQQQTDFEQQNLAEYENYAQEGLLEDIPMPREMAAHQEAEPLLKETSTAEKEIIELLFEGEKKIIKYVFNHLTPEDFTEPVSQHLAELVYDTYQSGEDILPGALIDKIQDEETKQFVIKMSLNKYSISKTWDVINPGDDESHNLLRYARDSIRKFRLFRIDKELKINYNTIKNSTDESEIMRLMKANNHLLEEKKLIQNESA